MSLLEKLFRLELEFHRRLRTQAPGTDEAGSLHTSYALATGYEQILLAVGTVADEDRLALRRQVIDLKGAADQC